MIHPELKTLCDRQFEASTKHAQLSSEHQEKHVLDIKLAWSFAGALGFAGFARMAGWMEINFWWSGLVMVIAFIVALRRMSAHDKRQNEVQKYYGLSNDLKSEIEERTGELQEDHIDRLIDEMILVDWQGKPAVVFSGSTGYAILKPYDDWEEVDSSEVLSTGKVIPDEDKNTCDFLRSTFRLSRNIVRKHMASTYDYDAYLDSLRQRKR